MLSDELFPRPLVKQVVFQLRFPNLFFLESKIGDYQVAIMQRFPMSKLLHKQQFFFAQVTEGTKLDMPGAPDNTRKVWQFESPEGVTLGVTTNSIDLSSNAHKSYRHPQAVPQFRDMIEFAVSRFLKITQVPIAERIGLRYVNSCPVLTTTNAWFRDWYNSRLPLDGYPIDNAVYLEFDGRMRRPPHFLRTWEIYKAETDTPEYRLDIDAYAEKTNAEEYLATTDALHALVINEFEHSIRPPVLEYMRKTAE